MASRVKLTGQECHLVLFAFDDYFNTQPDGKVVPNKSRMALIKRLGLKLKDIQTLRNKLFGAHEHFGSEN